VVVEVGSGRRRRNAVRLTFNACRFFASQRTAALVESRMGAVAWATRQRSVSHPRSSNRTCGFPASGLYGAFFVKRIHAIFVVLCHFILLFDRAASFILLFDPRREHSFVPTAYFHRRRAQRRSRTALQRRRRLVLDGREHGGRLPAIGWLAAR
jgi:hypothetical protein